MTLLTWTDFLLLIGSWAVILLIGGLAVGLLAYIDHRNDSQREERR